MGYGTFLNLNSSRILLHLEFFKFWRDLVNSLFTADSQISWTLQYCNLDSWDLFQNPVNHGLTCCTIFKNWYGTQPDLLISLLLTMDDLADNRLSWVVLDFFKRSLLVSFLDVFMFIIFWQHYYVKYIFLSKKWKAQLF